MFGEYDHKIKATITLSILFQIVVQYVLGNNVKRGSGQ